MTELLKFTTVESERTPRPKTRTRGATYRTQQIYRILWRAYPGMLTVADIHDEMRATWSANRVYAAYQKFLEGMRERERRRRQHLKGIVYMDGGSKIYTKGRQPLEPNTPLFEESARNWAIRSTLQNLRLDHSVVKYGSGTNALWKANLAKRPMVLTEITKRELRPMELVDIKSEQLHAQRRSFEHAKADLMELLSDRRIKGRTRDLIQSAYDHVAGRVQKT